MKQECKQTRTTITLFFLEHLREPSLAHEMLGRGPTNRLDVSSRGEGVVVENQAEFLGGNEMSMMEGAM
jgi:hypothetical protein